MKYRVRILTVIPALAVLFFASCAPIEQPPQDPTKEQITLLQKQLLELQKIQIDTKTKLDESTSTIDALTARLRTLEEKQHIRPAAAPAPEVESASDETKKIEPEKKQPPVKKKPVKKKAKKKKPAKKQKPKTQQPQTQQPQAQQPQAQQPQAQQPQAQQPQAQQPVRTQQ